MNLDDPFYIIIDGYIFKVKNHQFPNLGNVWLSQIAEYNIIPMDDDEKKRVVTNIK